MRTQKEIREEMARLSEELETVRAYESKTKAAVNILENLGWTHSNTEGWKKPKSTFSFKDYKAPLKAGELATWEDGAIRGTVYIRSVGDKFAQVSHVRGVSRLGVDVLNGSFAIENSKLTVRPREYFIGRR